MAFKFIGGNVSAKCPTCGGALTTYEHKSGTGDFGTVVVERRHQIGTQVYTKAVYKLLRCAGCGRGGMAEVLTSPNIPYVNGKLNAFYPGTIESIPIPPSVPEGIANEFREAELCSSVGAWRAASALLRSALEKALKANGYAKGSLATRIDEAAADGAITASRSRRAHEDVRVLGNEVVHDEWRPVTDDEFDAAHRYTQRVLEDLYDDRETVEKLLKEKKRLS